MRETNPSTLSRLREAFDTLVALPPPDRARWLDEHVPDPAQRNELLKLLAADAEHGYLDTSLMDRAGRFAAEDLSAEHLIGSHVGAFRLVREIGRGGMAAVFFAERIDGEFRQEAAVKLLRRGLYSELEQRLFLRERQLLATLEHPNIARLIDAGLTTARVPYLVMEYVDGAMITDHVEAAGIDTVGRLRLFVDVCRAVEAAHRRLIVHRDIKPSNILVTSDGCVKLLDFGIAKLLDEEVALTTATHGVFTPEYAAPEQLRNETVTTATDVYGLGVLLHELLTGRRPQGTPKRRPSSLVGEERAEKAVTVTPRHVLQGDLDNVVLKALDEEPARRYASAAALADDVENFLAGRPVHAHPASRMYRARKFVGRHRGSVATAVIVVLAIATSMALVVWQARVARAEAQRAKATRDFVESIFEPLRRGTPENKQPHLSELLSIATTRLDHADLDTAGRVDLLQMFAGLNEKVAEAATAQTLADRAYELASREFGPRDRRTLDALVSRGLTALHRDDMTSAQTMLQQAENEYSAAGVSGPPLIRLYDGLAVISDARGDDPQRTVAYERQALQQRIASEPENKASLGTGYNNLGYGLESLGDFAGAAEAYRKAFALSSEVSGADSVETAVTLSNLGSADMLAGQLRRGRDELIRAKALLGAAGGKTRPIQVANVQQICAAEMLINPTRAEDACAEDMRVTAQDSGTQSQDFAQSLRRQSMLAFERGDLDNARELLDRAATLLDQTDNDVGKGRIDISRGEQELVAGDAQDAARLLQRGLARIGGSYPPHLRKHALALLALACDDRSSDYCSSTTYDSAAHEIDAASYRTSATVLPAHTALARIDLAHGRALAAANRLQAALAGVEGEMDAAAPRRIAAQAWLAHAYAAVGRCDEASRAFQQAHDEAVSNHLEHHVFLLDVLAAKPSCAN